MTSTSLPDGGARRGPRARDTLPFLRMLLPSGREIRVPLRPDPPVPADAEIAAAGHVLHYRVPGGRELRLTGFPGSGDDGGRPGGETLAAVLAGGRPYEVRADLLNLGGRATLSLLEHGAGAPLSRLGVSLENRTRDLLWRTSPGHRALQLIVTLSGSGSLVLSGLSFSEAGPGAGEAPSRPHEPGISPEPAGRVEGVKPPALTWRIKSPEPGGEEGKRWGDHHFARSLARALRQRGQEVFIDDHSHWHNRERADVVLVLRGWHPFVGRAGGAALILWNISHPTEVSPEELEAYDAVCVASRSFAAKLRGRLSCRVELLEQCTDPERFRPDPGVPDGERAGIVFVGSNLERGRRAVQWAVELGAPLRIWGRRWAGAVDPRSIAGEYVENDRVHRVYGRARATLNEHWPDMLERGFLNNRTLDALACGLPVICDHHPDFRAMFPEGVLFYRDRGELAECLRRLEAQYPRVLAGAREAARTVRTEFTFGRRAEQLLALVLELKPGTGGAGPHPTGWN